MQSKLLNCMMVSSKTFGGGDGAGEDLYPTAALLVWPRNTPHPLSSTGHRDTLGNDLCTSVIVSCLSYFMRVLICCSIL